MGQPRIVAGSWQEGRRGATQVPVLLRDPTDGAALTTVELKMELNLSRRVGALIIESMVSFPHRSGRGCA